MDGEARPGISDRRPALQRGPEPRGPAPPAHGRPRADRPLVRAGAGRRREHRRHAGEPARAGGARPAGPRDPPAAQLRPDRGLLGGLRPLARRRGRHLGRRPAERPCRHPAPRREARAGRPRHGLRLAEGAPRPALEARSLLLRQPAHLVGDRRAAARLRLLAQGHAGRGGAGHPALRRDAPLHPGGGLVDGGEPRGGAGQPPPAHPRAEQVRDRPHGAGAARPLHGQVPPLLRHAAGAPLRAGRPRARGERLGHPRLPGRPQDLLRRGDRRAPAAAPRRAALPDGGHPRQLRPDGRAPRAHLAREPGQADLRRAGAAAGEERGAARGLGR